MKIRNVSDNRDLTVGKVYEALLDRDGDTSVIGDIGFMDVILLGDYEIIPEAPAPASDWMQIKEYVFINMVTGIGITFLKNKTVRIWFIKTSGAEDDTVIVLQPYADAFARLVGYEWGE